MGVDKWQVAGGQLQSLTASFCGKNGVTWLICPLLGKGRYSFY